MTASLHRLRTKPQRLRVEQADHLRQAILDFPELPDRAAGELLAALDRVTTSDTSSWGFTMISPETFSAVVDHLADHAPRPMLAVRLWTRLFAHLDRRTGEVLLSRDEMAAAVGAQPRDVSRVLTELEGLGAVSRRREKGSVRVFVSPLVGTHLGGAARDKAQAAAPALRLVPAT